MNMTWVMTGLVAGILAAAMMGCESGTGGGDDNSQTDNSSTTVNNETGIALPTNATEVADGVWVYQGGTGNELVVDVTSGEIGPGMVAVVQTGSNNTLSVVVRIPEEEEAEAEEATEGE
jgi:hypothetical protein